MPVFNPLEDFLYRLPAWDGKDRIRALAATVPCKNPYWMDLFHRWFLNMVSHWKGSNKKYANSVSPLLVGPQGTRKSTFCRSIMPPSERSYYTDSIDFSRKKDAELYLNRFALINIDEFDQVSSTQQGFLKHILQKPVLNVKKPHGSAVLEMRRYASFIATSNQKDLLTDPSGSRRFICIEVTGVIDTNRPIDYEQSSFTHKLCMNWNMANVTGSIRRKKRSWWKTTVNLNKSRRKSNFSSVIFVPHSLKKGSGCLQRRLWRIFKKAVQFQCLSKGLIPSEEY